MRGRAVMKFGSPYTLGAGAMPPYLAGRGELIENANKYGLRGVGKTVLLNAIEGKAEE